MKTLHAGLIFATLVLPCIVHAAETYSGMCDASAAVSIGKGRFVVADDELDVLRIYQKSHSAPVASLDLIDYLHNRKGAGKNHEGDLEGAAVIGDQIYWISSHARKGKDGSVDTHRQRLFATAIAGKGSAAFVKLGAEAPYESLLADLVADARFSMLAAASKFGPEDAPPKEGLNIEGLAATPEGGLLIGFRSPQPNKMALVVPLTNPADVVAGKAKPKFGDPIALDLGGRGIRSFERIRNEYLVVGGPRGEADKSPVKPAFALFRWSGDSGQQPILVRPLDDGSFRPEALFFDPDSNELVMLSDDGDEPVGAVACKDKDLPAAKKSFRAMRMAWAAPAVAAEPAVAAAVAAAAAPAAKKAAACKVEQSAPFAGETVRLAHPGNLPATARFGVFKAPLAVNTDGAPTSYHPDDYAGKTKAINHIENGIAIRAADGHALNSSQRKAVFDQWRASPEWKVPAGFTISWKNVIAADGARPCIFKQADAGYFGSLTALQNELSGAAAGECARNNQIDQRYIPAIVLRGGAANPLQGWGANKGDLVLAINPTTGVAVPAVIGDTGDAKRIGEGSVALNMALLGATAMPTTYAQAVKLDTGTRDMVVAVLPGSRQYQRVLPYSRDNIAQRVKAWAVANGYGSVEGLAAAAKDCAGPL